MEIKGNADVFPNSIVAVPLTMLYLCLLLSVPLSNISMIIWMGIYPIVSCGFAGLSYGRLAIKSLIILPICILIGIMNPYYQSDPAVTFGNISISEGWISLISISIRGLFALQSVIILTESYGFYQICRTLRKLYVPKFLTDQLQFVYRYLLVIIRESIIMRSAREARGYGRKSFPIKIWGVMIGQLFIRSIDRSQRISRAMSARGFNGMLPDYYGYINKKEKISKMNLIYFIFWVVALPLLRIFNLSHLIFH